MKYVYSFSGLDCPLCSNSLEKEIRRQEGVENVEIDFASRKIAVYAENEESAKKALNAAARIEPEFRCGEATAVVKRKKKIALSEILFITGSVLFAGAAGCRFAGFAGSVYLILNLAAYILIGLPVFRRSIQNIRHGSVFDENSLMMIASAGAFAVGEATEAVAVILFYRIGEYFQDRAVDRSRASITALMDLRPDTAYRETEDGSLEKCRPGEIVPGEMIAVSPGEQIPLDGIIVSGESSLDNSSLTGESFPRSVGPGDTVLSGSVNRNGVLRIRVTKPAGESTAARILELTENAASRKAGTERLMTRFAKIYTPVVVCAALLTVVIPVLFFGEPFREWLYRALIFLVISCPCALVISVPLGYFAGIGRASREGVLLKGGRVLETLENVRTAVFDKTGTLTEGHFRVRNLYPEKGVSEARLLMSAAAAENFSTHPVAECIRNAAAERGYSAQSSLFDGSENPAYREEAGEGVCVSWKNRFLLAGSCKLLERHGFPIPEESKNIGTVVYIADESGFLGTIELFDEIRIESFSAVSALRKCGVKKLYMLSGDRRKTAEDVSTRLGLDGFRAELLPGDKVKYFEDLVRKHSDGVVLFAGDGINDAPVLARADVGVAMGGFGSDAAIEAADAVLMGDDVSKLAFAIRLAKKTKTVVAENIILSLAVKAVVAIGAFFGYAFMWAAVFADVGVALLAVLNSMRILAFRIKTLDRKRLSVHTETEE